MSTIQKTGGVNYSLLLVMCTQYRLVWSGKCFACGFDHLDAVNYHIIVYGAILAEWKTNKQTPNQVILVQAYPWPVGPVFQSWKKKVWNIGFVYSVFWVLIIDFDLCKCEAMMTRKFKENALSILGQRWLKCESFTGRYLVLVQDFSKLVKSFPKW